MEINSVGSGWAWRGGGEKGNKVKRSLRPILEIITGRDKRVESLLYTLLLLALRAT